MGIVKYHMSETFDQMMRRVGIRSRRRGRTSGKKQVKQAENLKRIRRRNGVATHVFRSRTPIETAMDDVYRMNKQNQPQDGVIFGVYGSDEWITSSHVREAVDNKWSTVVEEGTWITDDAFSLSDWIHSIAVRYNFMSAKRAIAFMPWGIIEAVSNRGKLELDVNGDPLEVQAFIMELDSQMKRAENLVEWVYGTNGDSISVPLNYRPAIKGAYPWIKKDLIEYIDEYLNSDASVLILIGPPGTGKTTFIKNLIHRSKGNAMVTYDEKVMSDDSLFAQFIEGESKFLVMEDADAFLKSREDGNTMMHRFLNVSDGLISAADKKLVFSTNLPSIHDIDPALMRKGRAFDVLTFRALTRPEAEMVCKEMGVECPDGKELTLAELFHQGEKRVGRSIGFR